MIFAYIRVSTDLQDNGPEAQRQRIAATCDVDVWFEEHISGKSLNRPKLQELLAQIQRGDTLVVTKVDRLSRSVLDFALLMSDAAKAGWNINVLELGIDMTSPMGAAMVQMMAIFAELERRLIGQRTKDALAVVKVRGSKSGKPIGRPRVIAEDVRKEVRGLRESGLSLRAIGAKLGMTHTTVARILSSS
jgi:DNA invertase Pin-like site-specific DNA recombinase